MSIQIESIQIQNLGPLKEIEFDLGMLNLIYGHNESGKTYLVEFLLQSIFRHAKTWDMREIKTAGAVHIRGLQEQTITLSPTSAKKIEDYWQEDDSGLPLNMARLLVVKGGELALSSDSPGGVNRDVLKNALTSQAILDQIRDRIQPTVQKAKISNQQIVGKNQGQINDHLLLSTKLKDLDSLVSQIEQKYSNGPVRQIEIQIEGLESNLARQLIAKKHQAYLLSNKKQELLSLRENLSDDRYLAVRDQVRDYHKIRSDLTSLNKKISASTADLENFRWLDSAEQIWVEKALEGKGLPDKRLVLSGGSLLIAGLIITILQNLLSRPELFWPGVICAVIGGFLLSLIGIQLLRQSSSPADRLERDAIQSSFHEKFGYQLKSQTELRSERNNLQQTFLKMNTMQEEQGKMEVQLHSLTLGIKTSFQDLLGETTEEQHWEASINKIKEQSAALDNNLADLALEISKLNLEKDDQIVELQGDKYDPGLESELKTHLDQLGRELNDYQSNLDTLKARAVEWTRDEITSSWSDILHHLRTMRSELNHSLIALTAELIAKIGLSQILDQIEEKEDQKILENLNSGDVSILLKELTGKYQHLDLIDSQVFASDAYRKYPLRDLSTGAREQIQIALRLGMATHLSGGEPLFIILDDAFQHSDWERRKSLVQTTVQLATRGWQVIYLSMDDHIRDLYLEIAKPVLKRKFKYFDLS
jgi:uncharacterized protein YhaN